MATSLKKALTEREKAIIELFVRRKADMRKNSTWRQIFALAHATRTYEEAMEMEGDNISHLKNAPATKRYLEEITAQVDLERARMREEAIAQDRSRRPETPESVEEGNELLGAGVNFEDRNQFIRYLNIQANKITDQKQKLDYLKTLADLLRLKEDKPNSENEIQRFYVPLTCHECQLYINRKKEIEEEQRERETETEQRTAPEEEREETTPDPEPTPPPRRRGRKPKNG